MAITAQVAASHANADIYSIQLKTIGGESVPFSQYRGKVVLVVNVASKCGFTPQYQGLEKLYEKFKDRGFTVLGFPCNQFGEQEPGNEQEIKHFCELNYKVTFPMFAKLEVNGPGTHPLYAHLKSHAKGLLNTEAVKWNFTKFLVGKDGTVLDRFAPQTAPESLEGKIQEALSK